MKQACVLLALVALLPGERAREQRQSTISIELEDFTGAAKISGGRTARQDMGGFGPGWSRNAQLFWSAPTPADRPTRNWPHLAVHFTVPPPASYEVILHYTSAPDFGTFRVFLDGQPKADIDAYSAGVAPQMRALGHLGPGNHELLVSVFSKAAGSRGFSVGLDRIELRPLGGQSVPSGRARPARVPPPASTQPPSAAPQPPVAPPALAQLFFAEVSGTTLDWTAKGGYDKPFDGPNPTAHLIWESAASSNLSWRWQVSRQPFAGPLGSPPPGVIAEEAVDTSRFAIGLGKFLGGERIGAAGIDFYIRLVATDGAKAVAASNVVVAHYLPGNASATTAGEAIKAAEERKRREAALKAMSTLYTADVISFTPAMFADPNRWGCVVVVKNPYVGLIGHRLASYGPGEHCGKSYSGMGHTLTPWDYITGWAKAYEVVSQFYDEAKAWTAQQFANTLPCGMLGKAADECKKYSEHLAGVAINVGLSAAGVPPSLPDLNEVAKGQAVEAGVGFTCATIESNGGTCSPELKTALAKAYGEGLDRLEKQLDRTTKEPGCGSAAAAHEHGREPLPCFGDYPGVEFRPADGAVYRPPMVTVRVTRTAPGLPDLGRSEYELRADLTLQNRVSGQIESYYKPVPPTDLSGELFVPGRLTLPALPVGQSATVTLPMGGIKQYTFSTTAGGYAVHNGWCALYNGATGSVSVSATCRSANGNAISCAVPGRKAVQVPKDYKCTVG
jgi:hypothetical protein